METIFVRRLKEAAKAKKELEKRLDLKILVQGRRVVLEGDSVDAYSAGIVFDAIETGFSTEKALKLLDEEYLFRKIHIKDHTHRKELSGVRARLIGSRGRTRKVFEETSGCDIVVGESDVGIIGLVENVEATTTAVINLIKGSKQSNMYQYLQKRNREKKNRGVLEDIKLK